MSPGLITYVIREYPFFTLDVMSLNRTWEITLLQGTRSGRGNPTSTPSRRHCAFLYYRGPLLLRKSRSSSMAIVSAAGSILSSHDPSSIGAQSWGGTYEGVRGSELDSER